MTKLELKIQEITKHKCKQSELWTIINYVVNPLFETFDKVEETHILERGFELFHKPDKTLLKDMQDTVYITDYGYELRYNYFTNLLTIFSPNDEELIVNSKITNKLQFNVIMDSQQLHICEYF